MDPAGRQSSLWILSRKHLFFHGVALFPPLGKGDRAFPNAGRIFSPSHNKKSVLLPLLSYLLTFNYLVKWFLQLLPLNTGTGSLPPTLFVGLASLLCVLSLEHASVFLRLKWANSGIREWLDGHSMAWDQKVSRDFSTAPLYKFSCFCTLSTAEFISILYLLCIG